MYEHDQNYDGQMDTLRDLNETAIVKVSLIATAILVMALYYFMQ